MRPGAYSRKVGNTVFSIYKNLTPDVGLIDLKDIPREAFTPEAYEDRPRAIQAFSDRLLAAKGIVIVTPEYNSSVPGVLKHFIDLWKFPDTFKRKFSIISVSNGNFGGIRAGGHLGELLLNRGGNIFPGKVQVPMVETIFNEKDELTSDAVKKRLEDNAKAFLEFIK